MADDLVARASTTINAPAADVWDALVKPEKIHQYIFGTNVEWEWREGSPITFKGEWQGKPYEDRGTILRLTPSRLLQYTHFSPMAGQPDVPENDHTITIELTAAGSQTKVALSQDHNATEEERAHSEQNWTMMLDGLKKFVEKEA
ncbi:MAG TPA: SRPBCC family protein [Thermoanaerobaculia bacterium]|nr:SRPBCC family protein [Thermoanaerobaculia bacterium]